MMNKLSRRIVIAVVAVLAVAITGGAIAATQLGSSRQESQAVLDDAAKELGVESGELSAALRNALAKRVDAAVAAGRLTKAEGDALKTRIRSGEVPLFAGPGMHRGFGRGHGPGMHFHMHKLDAAASYLGLTEAQLRTQLSGGKTLAQVARDRDKSVDGLVDALVKAANVKLEQAVEDGRLTQAQANELKEGQRERISDFVNNGQLRFRFRGGPGRGLDPEAGLGESPALSSPLL